MGRYLAVLLTLTITLLSNASQAQGNDSLSSPIIPVTELKDVKPTDWAFSALQQLQQNYQCIQGYPNQTFRGEQEMTRYEFAALLHRCLTQLQESLTNEEQPTIARLQNEFARELSILRGKVDAATARVRELEVTQFSTTTKLKGVVNLVVTDSSQEGETTQPLLQARSRLDFNTSFTGQDQLLTRFTSGNSDTPDLANRTPELTQTHQWRGNTDNQFLLSQLAYGFPLNNNTRLTLSARGGQHFDENKTTVNPFFEDNNAGTTTLSTFAQRNPILSLGGGTGVSLSHHLNDALMLGVSYYATDASNASNGLFNGSYSGRLGVKWDVNTNLSVGVNYLHSYFQKGEFGFSDGLSPATPILGTGVVNDALASFPTVTNAYGVEVFWKAKPKLGLGGRLGYTDVQTFGAGDGEIWNYSFSVVFPELGQRNNLGGIIVGTQPYLGSLEGKNNFNNDRPWHLEGFYKWQISDRVSLTPGIILQLNPNQNSAQEDILTSTMRMTIIF